MGFRSTFTTSDYNLEFPQWFIEKYETFVNFSGKGNNLPLSAKAEFKTYTSYGENLAKDIQTVMKEQWKDAWSNITVVLVWLHECGGITRIEIRQNEILYSEPEIWNKVDNVTHDYCYGCSDVKNITTR